MFLFQNHARKSFTLYQVMIFWISRISNDLQTTKVHVTQMTEPVEEMTESI